MKILDLAVLEDGSSTGLSIRNGGFLAEAASVGLHRHSHPKEILLQVEGDLAETYLLRRLDIDQRALNSYDRDEASQFGAMGIAVAILLEQKGWKVVRSWKGTGFDYWVGEEEDGLPFQHMVRVEVSGDHVGTDAELRTRLRQKLEQTKVSDALRIPAYGIVVEFSNPKSLTGKR